jgi:hypothetical protein
MIRRVMIAGCMAALLAGCGQSDSDKAKDRAEAFYTALQKGDGKKACGMLTDDRRRRFDFDSDTTDSDRSGCVDLLSGATGPAVPKDPRADSVDIHGGEAIVIVSGRGGVGAKVTLSKVGDGWKVSDF